MLSSSGVPLNPATPCCFWEPGDARGMRGTAHVAVESPSGQPKVFATAVMLSRMPSCDGHQFDPWIAHQEVRANRRDFPRSEIARDFRSLRTENGLSSRFGAFGRQFSAGRAQSLWPHNFVSRVAVRARGEEQRARRSGEGGEERRAGAPKDSPRVKAVIAPGY